MIVFSCNSIYRSAMQSSKMSKTLARYPVLLPRKYLQPYTSLRIFNSYLQDFCNLCVCVGGWRFITVPVKTLLLLKS
jgi:hypothetical protein